MSKTAEEHFEIIKASFEDLLGGDITQDEQNALVLRLVAETSIEQVRAALERYTRAVVEPLTKEVHLLRHVGEPKARWLPQRALALRAVFERRQPLFQVRYISLWAH